MNSRISADAQDPLGRKPVHLACYNSLEVLNILDIPDSDFKAKDIVGRVPLLYAALSGQPDLVQEVIARSERVGIGIDVQDTDGWTPLLWAARNSAVKTWSERQRLLQGEVTSLILSKGADKTTSAGGLFQDDWTAIQIAFYHNADRYAASRVLHPRSTTATPNCMAGAWSLTVT